MDFGVCMMPKTDRCAEDARMAEACGFTHVWVTDSHLMSGDAYVCLALIAKATSKVTIGTAVAIPGTRIAPVIAGAIASINQLAPGRVVLGIGTGNTARRSMGFTPYRLGQLREYVRVIRGLLSGGEVDYAEGETHRAIRFFHQDMRFVNTRDRIPIYVAANAPKAVELVGEIGDGFITARTNTVEGWRDLWGKVTASARRHGKDPAAMYSMMQTSACLIRPGESLDSPRVRAEAGPWAAVALHSLYEAAKTVEDAPPPLRPVFSEYKPLLDRRFAGNSRYYMELHDGHCLYLRPDEERFVTPDVIRFTTMTSTPEEMIERLRALSAAGVRQVDFFPTQNGFADFVRDFSDKVIARL